MAPDPATRPDDDDPITRMAVWEEPQGGAGFENWEPSYAHLLTQTHDPAARASAPGAPPAIG